MPLHAWCDFCMQLFTMVENSQFYASHTVFACNYTPNIVVGLPTKMAVVYILDLVVTSGEGAL